MSEKRFSIWQVIGVVVVALGLLAAAAGGGAAMGYRWGRTAGRVEAYAGQGASGAPYPMPPGRGRNSPNGVSQPYLGVEFQTITAEVAQSENLPVESGALIRAVAPGGPAETAGVKVGDIVQQLDGTALDVNHTLRALVVAHQPGEEITLTALRGAETQTIKVTLGETAGFGELFEPGYHFQFPFPNLPGGSPAPSNPAG